MSMSGTWLLILGGVVVAFVFWRILVAVRSAKRHSTTGETPEDSAGQAARREAERLAAEEAARREAERLATEEAACREAEHLAAEEAARREAERLAAEEAARREAERLAAQEAARREAERLAAEEAARREAEHLAAEEAARREAEHLAAEEAARREAERLAAEEAARRDADRRTVEEALRREEEERLAVEAAIARESARQAAEEARRREQAVVPPAMPAFRTADQTVVMVADDSKVVRIKTGRLLAAHSFQVVMAEDGTDAAQKIEHSIPDVLVTDVDMPGMTGLQLARQVRGNPRTAALPIIIVTSDSDQLQDEAAAAGVNVVLGKPYPEALLIEHIEQLARVQPAA